MSPTKMELVEKFDTLSDDHIIPDEVAAIICNQSSRTMRRNNLIPRIKTGLRSGGRRVKDVRALARGQITVA
jgi:hypothetical protein